MQFHVVCVRVWTFGILHKLWVNITVRLHCTCLVHVMFAEYGEGHVHIMIEFGDRNRAKVGGKIWKWHRFSRE